MLKDSNLRTVSHRRFSGPISSTTRTSKQMAQRVRFELTCRDFRDGSLASCCPTVRRPLHMFLLFLLNNKLDYRTQNFTISLLVVILKRFMFFSSCCYLNIFQIYSQSTCSCDMDDFSKTQNQQLLTFKAAAGKSV